MVKEKELSKVIFFDKDEKLHESLRYFNCLDFKNKKIPIKLHLGEIRNKYHVKPAFVKHVVDELKNLGAEPFLFDTTVLYLSIRRFKIGYKFIAAINGYLKIGCNVVIGDKGKNVYANNRFFEVAEELCESTHIIAISHVTGHHLTGFAGAIKNFGMGGVTKKEKKRIHHGGQLIQFDKKCSYCEICVKTCSYNAITIEKDNWILNEHKCIGCGSCVKTCPEGALSINYLDLQKGLSQSIKAVVKGKIVIYINVLKNITPHCDCGPSLKPPICEDIGYLISNDPVAIDKASIDIVNKKTKSNIFQIINKVNPMVQIKYGEEIKLGSSSYKLIEL
jgi:uncharacterized Fe-S center protein